MGLVKEAALKRDGMWVGGRALLQRLRTVERAFLIEPAPTRGNIKIAAIFLAEPTCEGIGAGFFTVCRTPAELACAA